MLPVTALCSPLPWQRNEAPWLWPAGAELQAPKLVSGDLPVPYLSKGNVKLCVSNGFKIKEILLVLFGFFYFIR